MNSVDATVPVKGTARPSWRNDLALALIATLVSVAVDACSGFRALTNAVGDNDSLLRLVEVRDMLAGQGWFDLHQYRMGLEGGFVMHWSRLVDAPLAAIILVASALTGSMAMAEAITQVLWPALLLLPAVFFIVRAARGFAGVGAVLPAVVIGTAALHFIGIFSAGALDHHNVQLTLTLASLSLLLEAPKRRWAALFSGLCAALTLAVGMETAPYVATIGACISVLFVLDPVGERRIARDFGLGFAGVSALVFVTTIPPSAWGLAQCDAFSAVQFVVALVAGLGLVVVTSLNASGGTASRRLIALGLLASVLGAVVIALFPQCLSAPYANVDPRFKEFLLDHIDEAQSLFDLAVNDPASVAARYVTPLMAIILMAFRLRGPWRRQDILVGALLVTAFIVSAWQIRGSTFSIAFAVIPLSGWVATWRERARISPSRSVSLRMAAVWLVSVNAVWTGTAAATATALEAGRATADGKAAGTDAPCERKVSFDALSRLPNTAVLAISNLGSPILAYSGHRVFAGPYHRNIAGYLLALDAFVGSADDARAIVEAHHVGLVAVCSANGESKLLAEKAPAGFLAQLARGVVPAWLEPVEGTAAGPLQLYRVK